MTSETMIHNGYTQTLGGSTVVRAGSINEATLALCRAFRDGINQSNERRGMSVFEMVGPTLVEITNPVANVLMVPGRNNDPWVSACEFPWLVAGRNDIAWIQHYLPRAADFSDDGLTWRAGYGPRLRAWNGGHPGVRFDQLGRVLDLLAKHPDSRQAVISLWDPLADLAPTYAPDTVEPDHGWAGNGMPPLQEKRYRDYPCTNWLHFQISAGYLDLTVAMRSNDLFWGFSGVNVYNFTMLQQLAASCLGVGVGTYRHLADNLHVYERHFDALARIAAGPDDDVLDYVSAEHPFETPTDLGEFTADCRVALDYVANRRGTDTTAPLRAAHDLNNTTMHPYLTQWAVFMLLHNFTCTKEGVKPDDVYHSLTLLSSEDMRVAATVGIARHMKRHNLWNSNTTAYLLRSVAHLTGGDPVLEYLNAELR